MCARACVSVILSLSLFLSLSLSLFMYNHMYRDRERDSRAERGGKGVEGERVGVLVYARMSAIHAAPLSPDETKP